jgi:hypothetical protein
MLLICSAAQKMKSSLTKTSSRCAGSRSSVVWCFASLCRPLALVISFILRLDAINTSYTAYFTICRFMCET